MNYPGRWLLALSLAALLPYPVSAATTDGDVVAVLEIRSGLVGDDRKLVDAGVLTDRVRDVARRTLPAGRVLGRDELPASRHECTGDCAVSTARNAGASLLVTGGVLRVEHGFLVSLEARATASGKLVSSAASTGNTPEELVEAVASAAVDLFRGLKSAAAVAAVLGAVSLPEVPAPSAGLHESGVVDLDIDPNVLVAYDKARTSDASGKERPEEAAAAWRMVAELRLANPLREMAAARAVQWQDYADGKRAFEAQIARDTDRLRKLLLLGSVSETTKTELLLRYARVYGVDKASPLLAFLPDPDVREHAGLALWCEAKAGPSCVAMARIADEAKDPQTALAYLDRACALDGADACAEAGDRWLRAETRDVSRAIPALQRGCAAGGATACTRLARVYEEGDGTSANPTLASEMRDKACAAGDGNSCRRLACAVDSDDKAVDQARAARLWEQGCANGDAPSCAIANAAAGDQARPGEEGPVLGGQVEEALAGTQLEPATRPASTTLAVGTERAGPLADLTAQARATYEKRSRTGFALIGLGFVAAGGAAFMALQDAVRVQGRGEYGRVYYREDSSRANFAVLLGALGVVSAGTGLAVLLSRPDPTKPQVSLGVAPGRLMLSGTIP